MAGNKNLNLYAIPSVLLIFFGILANNIKESEGIPQNLSIKQNEVIVDGPLLNDNGALYERGWARSAIKELEEKKIARLTPFRYKKWDFYSVFTQDLIIGTVITDLGHAGMGFLHIYDTKNNKKYYVNEEIMPWKKPHQPPETFYHTSNLSYHGSNVELDFTNKNDEVSGAIIKTIKVSVREPKIELSYVITRDQDHEDIVTLTPMSEDSRYFFYNAKAYTYKVRGQLVLDGVTHSLDETNALGGQDLGRGTWPYNSFWLWASANGFHEGKRIGINLGGGFQVYNASKATEDSLFVNGKIIKLNVCEYKYNENSHENGELWSFITPTQNVPGSAKIFFEVGKGLINPKTTNYYFIKSELKQFYGKYRGEVIDSKGNLIKFDNIPGFAEVHRARW